jgi:ABC-2 type transport system permease protein
LKSPFFTLIRKDLKGYFDQPTGYILIVIFVAMLSWAFFKTALLLGETSLRPLFTVEFAIDRPSLPWLMTLFIPAATMRLLSEEHRDGTLETLLTQPIRGWVVLVTKFLSGLIFVSIAILATIAIPITLTTAGNLDWGAVISQYIASIFLAGCLVSIGLFTSSLTRNQIVSFILGLTVSMVLMIMGLEIVAITLPSGAANLLQLLSPITHFDNVGRGVIDLRDLLYFLSLISTFLSATFLIMRSRTLSHRTPQYRNLQLGVAGFIILSILVGWFGTSIKGRLDLTEDKIFSLSPATVQIIDNLDDLLTVDVFMSNDPPVQVSLTSRDVNDFLNDFESNSDDMVKVSRHYPEDDETAARKAQNAGINPVQFELRSQGELQIKTGYLGISLTYLDKREVIPFVDSVDGFEYQLASLTNKMVNERLEKKKIGFLEGHGESSIADQNQLNFFARVLNQQYQVSQIISEENDVFDLTDIDILVIASPKKLISSKEKQEIQRFLRDGGSALIALEPVVIDRTQLTGLPNRDDFGDFVREQFGISVEQDIVYDTRSFETISFQSAGRSLARPYPYFVRSEVTDKKIGREIRSVVLPWVSSVGVINIPGNPYKITPLLSSSQYGAIDFEYRNLTPDTPTFTDISAKNMVQSDLGVTAEGQSGSKIVVIGDAEWLETYFIQRFQNNAYFGLNLIDWLAQDDTLASVRSKVVSERNLVFSSDTHKNIVQYVNIVGIPIAFVIIAFLRYTQRRSKGFRTNWRSRAVRLMSRNKDQKETTVNEE